MLIKLKCAKDFKIKNIDKNKIREMLKYSIPLIPCDISWWIMNVSDRTIVSIVLGTTSNAILSVANKIPNICQNIFNVFHLSWQENAIETLKDDDKGKYYVHIINNMLQIITSICIVILSMNFFIFEYIFTEEYYTGYYQVPILILSIIASMLAQFLGSLYIANMESKKSGKTTILAAILNIFVHLTLIRYIKLYAATISTLISYIFLFIIRYVDINKKIKLKFERKSVILIICLSYFIIFSYLNIKYINYINTLIAILIFIYTNKEYITKVMKRNK